MHGTESVRCPWCMLFPCMNILSKIANHLDMLKADRRDPDQEHMKYQAELAKMVFGPHLAEAGGQYITESFVESSSPKNCGKLLALIKLLKGFHDEGAKVLVFSQSVQMLNILASFMARRGYEYRWVSELSVAQLR